MIFDHTEEEDLNDYLKHLSIKENIDPQNYNNLSKLKAPRSKFYSNADLKNYAKEHKTQIYNQFQSQMQGLQSPGHGVSANNPKNYNINYNINQNINQNINHRLNQGKVLMDYQQWEGQNFQAHVNNFAQNGAPHLPQSYNSPNPVKFYASSPNDSGNFSLGEEYNNINFISLRPTPKRNQSSGNIDQSKRKDSTSKIKASLFMSADKEEKGEDFADLQELMNSITGDLWDYAKSQKGSRYLIYFYFYYFLKKPSKAVE